MAAVLLIAAGGTATAQIYYWGYDPYRPKARGYYGTPYGGGPQYGDGGGDYSCAANRRAVTTGTERTPEWCALSSSVPAECTREAFEAIA